MRRYFLAGGLVLPVLLLSPLSAHAQQLLTLKVEDDVAQPNSDDFLDVFFLEPVPDAGSENLGAYNIQVDLAPIAGASGVSVTSTSRTSGIHPPVLATGSFGSTGTTATKAAGNADVPSGSEQDIDNLEGALRIFYHVNSGASGSYTLTINPITEFTNGLSGDPIPFTPVGGTLTVAVPEPGSLSLLAGTGLLAMRRRRPR